MRRIAVAVGAALALAGGAAAAPDADGWIALFDGKDETGWALRNPEGRDGWSVIGGALVHRPDAGEGRTDLISLDHYWNFEVRLEYRLAEGSDGGVFLRGRYEIRLRDDAGRELSASGTGSIFAQKAASANASRTAGEWNLLEARLFEKEVTVSINGTKVIDRHILTAITPGSIEAVEDLPGPLMLRGNRGEIAFRDIRIRPIREPGGDAIVLFDGKTKRGWRLRDPKGNDGWTVENGVLRNVPARKPGEHGTDLVTIRDDFFDFRVHIEFMLPQGSNSGVYLRGNYEIQLLGDHGMEPSEHTCGALYGLRAPSVNASRPGGAWQSLDALIRHDARGTDIWAVLNGRRIIGSFAGAERVPRGTVTAGALLPGQTGWYMPGPLRLQGDHGEVSFRNLWIKILPGSPAAPAAPAGR
ncbi:MAG: DUF1080 domain-containing protein [Planctomycetes bacterium]|nr:DUF1080 domain-containing protein [Planctomycetota bacterium]